MKEVKEVIIYERKSDYVPRVAAVHDMCGYGKCSLGVAIPVLSAGGIDCCPVPTAIFSSHTKYKTFKMHDIGDDLSDYLDAWRTINVDIDGVYSGFLGSDDQVDLILRLYKEYPHALRIVDPVMGDEGKMYPTYTPELCEAMGRLAHGADLLTPNLTEAAILTGREYQSQSPSEEELKALIKALLEMGPKNLVLKGIERGGKILNYIASQEAETLNTEHDLLPFKLHGTGDLFASLLTAALFNGIDLFDSVELASEMVKKAMLDSQNQPDYEMRGVSFELQMAAISAALKKK